MEGEERVVKLTGEDAKAFEKYYSEPLSDDEIVYLEEMKEVYRKYSSKSK